MTQFFDFVSYALGLTKLKWMTFLPVLIISILSSDAPFVYTGYSLMAIKSTSFEDIVNGNANIFKGHT